MNNIINFCTLLLLIPFFHLNAQDTIDTSAENSNAAIINTDKINLMIDFVPATTYRFTNSVSQKIRQELMGNHIEATKTVTYTASCEVISNDGKETKIKAIYEKILVAMDMPQGNLTFDSEHDSTSSPLSKLVDHPFFIYLNHEGKVDREEGLSDILEETNYNNQSTILASLAFDLFNEHNISKMIDATFTIFPDHPIGIGDSWQQKNMQRVNDQFNLNNTTTYTLESLNEDLAWINIEGAITSSMGTEDSLGEVNMEGVQSGIFEVDRPTGLILSNDTHQEVEGVMKAQGFEVPIKIITDSSIKGEKL